MTAGEGGRGATAHSTGTSFGINSGVTDVGPWFVDIPNYYDLKVELTTTGPAKGYIASYIV